MENFAAMNYWLIAGILILAGLLAGFIGSFFGIGGGTVLVPALLGIYAHLSTSRQIDMHQAVAVSLALVVFNTLVASITHHKNKNIPLDFFKGWALWLVIGCIIAAMLMNFVSALLLKILFTLYLFAAVAYQLLKKEILAHEREQLPTGLTKSIGGIIIGALSMMLGLAGGTFSTPFITFFGYPLKKAMAIAVASGVIIGALGTVAGIIDGLGVSGRLPYSLGYVNIPAVILTAPFVMLSSSWGVKASLCLSNKTLNLLYALFLLFLGFYMSYNIIVRHFL